MLTIIMKLDSIKMISDIVCVKHPMIFYGCFFNMRYYGLGILWGLIVKI